MTAFEGDPDPVFVTLPIGKAGTTSRNGRYYDDESMQLIVNAINAETVMGQMGHLREEDRPYDFTVPPAIWLAAKMESDGRVWAKAYIFRHATALREYIKFAKQTEARTATSLYGTAEVDDKGRVRNLEIESVDFAHPKRIGVLDAAAVPAVTKETEHIEGEPMSQKIEQEGESARLTSEAATEATSRTTSESSEENPTPIAEAEVKNFKVGDWVGWEKEGQLVRGRINTIWTEGDVEVPRSDELVITASAENPVARMDVYEPVYGQSGKWQVGWQQVVHYFSSLTAIEALSESQIIRPASQGDKLDMATIQEMENRITELERQLSDAKNQHTGEVRKLKTNLSEMEGQIADFTSVSELLGKPTDVVVAVQALQADNKSLRRENGDLLQESIKLQVADKVKVEAVRPVIEQMVRDRKPARRVDVTTALEESLQQDYVKTLLKIGVQEAMGPAHERPATPASEDASTETYMYVPGGAF